METKTPEYVNIQGWMYNLGLDNPRALMAYAVIFGFSQDGESTFCGGRKYLASATMTASLSTVDNFLNDLLDRHLIIAHERIMNGVRFVNYTVNFDAVPKIGVVVRKSEGDSTEIEHRTISENKNNTPTTKGRVAKQFVVPTPEEVSEYARSIGFELDGTHFVDYYSARGWLISKYPMKDWKAAVRTWKSRRDNDPGPTLFHQPSPMRPAYQAPAREGMVDHNSRVLAEAMGMRQNNLYNNPTIDDQNEF